jgi:hypothetical protein
LDGFGPLFPWQAASIEYVSIVFTVPLVYILDQSNTGERMTILAIRKSALPAGKSYVARAHSFVKERGVGIGLEIAFNFLLPFVVYTFCESPLGPAHALMAAATLPLVWAVSEFARRRRIDALSVLVLAGLGLSLLVYMGGGSIRFLQLREKLVTASVGLVFLGSAMIGRPLMYQLGRATVRRRNPSELGAFEALKDNIHFRRTMMTLTLVWGGALVAEAALATVLVFSFSVRQYLLVGPALGYATMGAVGCWSFLYVRRQRRKGLARQTATADNGRRL